MPRHTSIPALLATLSVLAAGLGGCAKDEPVDATADVATPPVTSSGTRLRAKVIEGGGAREVVGFFDTARNEDCTFREVGEGRWACLPISTSGGLFGTFADAACTVPIGSAASCGGTAKYVAQLESRPRPDGCGTTQSIGSLRAVLRPATTAYVQTGNGCTLQGTGSLPAGAVELGPEIALDQFVSATETTTKNGDLGERLATAIDGARQHLGYYVTTLNADCTFQVMADGTTRCVPGTVGSQLFYSDASCATPAATYSFGSGRCSSPAGRLVRDANPDSCGAARAIYTVAEDASGDSVGGTYYGRSGGSSNSTCTALPQSSSGSSNLRAITDVTPSLPKVSRVGSGGGRLVPAFVATSSTGALTRGWHDNEKNLDCVFGKASDGKLRCLPTAPKGILFYTDGACSSPSRVVTYAEAGGCTDTSSGLVRVADQACGAQDGAGVADADATTRIYKLAGTPREVPGASYSSQPGKCARVEAVRGATDAVEEDPAGFVEGVLVTE
jgi:hypothetical protein